MYFCTSKMSDTVCHNAKNKISKWLFVVVLFLSAFAFSGLPQNSSFNPYQQQTCVLASKPNKVKNNITFNGVIKRANVKPIVNPFIVSPFRNLISVHNKQISICLKSRPITLNEPTKGFFYRVKTNTPNNENPAISLV